MRTSNSKSTRIPDQRELARQVVDEYLKTALSLTTILYADLDAGDDQDNNALRPGGPWRALLEAVGAKEARLARGYDQESARLAAMLERGDQDESPVLWALIDTASQAGFLIGLELGRRLGGAR